ncbi:protein of unknown function [Candidatus Methylocalor cossyra]|uniref:Uncharacterized protein n=1 Tax=Candidatus Methylocalor cossyra TaxID=3108543 RepID=A0ABM9NJ40_9GAMM
MLALLMQQELWRMNLACLTS